MNKYDVILTDLFEWLESYDGPRFQAVLSDPPYALISIAKRYGKEGSAPAQEYEDGRFTRLSGGFMGQTWDGFQSLEHYQSWVSEWAKLLIEKALHPGAVCLFFGGTRTHHHLGVGLERGGFEIVDCIMWLHGQGFPKSHDISKGMDKAANQEGEIIEKYGGTWGLNKTRFEQGYRPSLVTPGVKREPATPEAKQWHGYGTALKPAWEPIFLCRAPRGDKTFAQLATEFGTGALNIDGARIGQGGSHGGGQYMVNSESVTHGEYKEGYKSGEWEFSNQGRWPANLILSHHEDCVKVGEFKVEGRIINRFNQGMMPFGNAEGEEYESEQMPDEIVERWACVPGCPVRVLDDQAGIRTAGHRSGKRNKPKTKHVFGEFELKDENPSLGSSGYASRFFYTSKSSRAEKDKGVENFYWKRTDEGFERVSVKEYEKLSRRERARGCIHPTVKPLDIARYLATMMLPPSGDDPRRILIPFSGSGSEMIGAAQAGWEHVTGIEFEEQYVDIAKARIRGTLGLFAGGVE